LIDLWVAGYSFCENVHADRHCDPRDARLAVHLCTTDGAPADVNDFFFLGVEYQSSLCALPRNLKASRLEVSQRMKSNGLCLLLLLFALLQGNFILLIRCMCAFVYAIAFACGIMSDHASIQH